MTALVVLVLIVLLACVAAALTRAVVEDGYGHRPPPRSHPSDGFGPAHPTP